MRSEKILNGLSKLGDMFILNFIYVLSCIPIITIGASTTALYYTTLKMAENNESYVWRDYWKAFKSNLKQATVIWLIVFAGWAVVALDFLIAGGLSMQLGTIVAIGVVVVAVFLGILGLYVFPLLARFDNTVVRTMKNDSNPASAFHNSDCADPCGAASGGVRIDRGILERFYSDYVVCSVSACLSGVEVVRESISSLLSEDRMC